MMGSLSDIGQEADSGVGENKMQNVEADDAENGIKSTGNNVENKMGTAPVGRLLASMAWPAILSMTIAALYNIVDSIFVAMISPKALTAVSLILPVQILMISIAVGSAIGVNSLIARRLGSRQFEEANKVASTSIRIGVFNYLVFSVLGLLFSGSFMSLYSTESVIFGYGTDYLRIVTICCLFSMVELQLEKVLQATGNMVAPMLISLSGAVTNIILDPVLIFGLLGFPRLEVKGAAIATVIGQGVSLLVATYIVRRKENAVKISIKGFKVEGYIIKEIYAVGFPAMIMQAISSVMLLGYNRVLTASAAAVAVLGVYVKLQSFVFMPLFGLNQGAMPIIGYNYGAKNRERMMEAYKKALMAAFIIMLAGFAMFQTIPASLLKLFSADEEMLKVGVPALRIISLCFLPAAFDVISSAMFQSTGHGMYSLFASLIRQLVGILPLAYILYNCMGLRASWFSIPLAEILGLTYTAIMFCNFYRKDVKNL